VIGDAAQNPKWNLYASSTYYFQWKPEVWSPKPSNINGGKGDPNATLIDLDEDTEKAVGYMRYRHNEGANLVYTDGHAKYARKGSLKLRQFRYEFQTQ
jgi:prepilin-type processing-associated H-X9-DG protein